MTKTQTAQTVDNMIGAAQKLEAAARRLREEARHVRAGSLHSTMDPALWRDHKVADVKRAAEAALRELGSNVSLVESEPWHVDPDPLGDGAEGGM